MKQIAGNQWNQNKEGYADSTVGIALQKISREERKKAMAKKRRCRRTVGENAFHKKAVKMRKMTDEQLVHYVEDQVEKARSEGFNQGRGQSGEASQLSAVDFVEEIGRIKGIGAATMYKIRELLGKRLEAKENV